MHLPGPFLAQMKAHLGVDFTDFLEALALPAPISIHLNVLKNKKSWENYEGVKWYKEGVYLSERPSFTLDPAFHAGAYYVQEASSMLIAGAVRQLIDLNAPVKALDLCAAPGGKSTLLASLLNKDSLLVCNEVIRSRYQVLDYNLTKWGMPNQITSCQDVVQFRGVKEFFDLILVDAPCSGEGLFRKDPQAVAEWSVQSVAHCSARQKRILADTIDLLKPGGVLLYSTCTYNDLENDGNAAWLLEQFPLEIAELDVPEDWGVSRRKIGWQCYPHLVKGEGFYLAAFRKATYQSDRQRTRSPQSLKYYEPLNRSGRSALESWIRPDRQLRLLQSEKAGIIAVPESMYEDLLALSPDLRYFRTGLAVGTFKRADLVPDPALALSTLLHPGLTTIELDLENALRFLKKEIPDVQAAPGWQLVSYQGLPLGWVKVLPNRINNYYPKEWKIRKDISW